MMMIIIIIIIIIKNNIAISKSNSSLTTLKEYRLLKMSSKFLTTWLVLKTAERFVFSKSVYGCFLALRSKNVAKQKFQV